jgi:hypothetical protein
MAEMYPPEVSERTVSHAERKVFGLIRQDLARDWIALHSVGIACHQRKPWAEIDFVLIGPPGIFCLEVKGGRVARCAGRWSFTDGDGNTSVRDQGPFEQVGPAAAALRAYLIDKFRSLREAAVGYGVVTPDIVFSVAGPDIEPKVVYDKRDAVRPFSAYLRKIADYWHERLERMHAVPIRSLSESDRRMILDELRGDFDFRPSLGTRAGQINEELVSLTKEQFRILDGLRDNARNLIRGGAGSGKTLLAIEEARRRAGRGDRVCFCCRSEPLAMFLKESVKDCQNVEIHHFETLMRDLVKQANLSAKLPAAEEADLFAVFYPELALEALIMLDRFQSYDVLIVDEAQDLLLNSLVDVFDALLKGGLEHGQWMFFMDPYQDVFEAVSPEGLERLLKVRVSQFSLSINCRNTRPIAVATSILSGVKCEETLRIDGPDVEHHWCRDKGHECREVSKCIDRWLSGGIKPAQVVVLSRLPFQRSAVRGSLGLPYLLKEAARPVSLTENFIRFATVSSFKGLEADAIAVVDVDDLEAGSSLLSLYVGTSRAKAFLAVFLADRLKGAYELQAFEYGRRLAVS